jgi:hypothetical protein
MLAAPPRLARTHVNVRPVPAMRDILKLLNDRLLGDLAELDDELQTVRSPIESGERSPRLRAAAASHQPQKDTEGRGG